MAQCPRLSHPQGQDIRRWQRPQNPDQHGLHRAMEVQSDLVKDASTKARRGGCRDSGPGLIDPTCLSRSSASCTRAARESSPPRVTTGPILLTGLAVCATCGGGMTLRTGTSKERRVYRYYTCSTCANKGKTVCKGRSFPMDKLDRLVTTHLLERLFKPERLAADPGLLSARRSERAKASTADYRIAEGDDRRRR